MNAQVTHPTSIRIFLADGTPDGIRIVEKSNWTGKAVVAGRAQLAAALKRDEMARPGVYVLTLTGPGVGGQSRIYVGEADVLRERLKQHQKQKDFWTGFVAFTSTDGSLNKALVRYVESKLVARAKKANQWEVENSAAPAEPALSEADRADAEWFLREMLVIYPILGIDAFESAADEASSASAAETLTLSQQGAQAKGREVNAGFVVLSNSLARKNELKGLGPRLSELRAQLLEKGVLEPDGVGLRFTQDYRFTSPSSAASVLVGTSSNGLKAWKTAGGKTLKQVQAEGVETVV